MFNLVHQYMKYDGSGNWWESNWYKVWLKLARLPVLLPSH